MKPHRSLVLVPILLLAACDAGAPPEPVELPTAPTELVTLEDLGVTAEHPIGPEGEGPR